MNRRKFEILINGKKNIFSYVYTNTSWFQFNTELNKEAHTFNIDISKLKKGIKFETNGCKYEIL